VGCVYVCVMCVRACVLVRDLPPGAHAERHVDARAKTSVAHDSTSMSSLVGVMMPPTGDNRSTFGRKAAVAVAVVAATTATAVTTSVLHASTEAEDADDLVRARACMCACQLEL
jgi:hypothetical protein